MAENATRILLADDHALVRTGLRLVLEREPDLIVVAEAENGPAAIKRALGDGIDLAILDVSMPQLTGLQATRQILAHRPAMTILLLSGYDDERFLLDALDAGAAGYVLKAEADQHLIAACRTVMRGDPFVSPTVLTPFAREQITRFATDGERGIPDALTPRETEVVKLIAEGFSAHDIGEILSISEKTVDRHRSNVLEKLGLPDRVALTRYAIRRGLTSP